MEILGMVYNNTVGIVIGLVGGGVGRLIIKHLWEKYKPVKPFVDYAEGKARLAGVKTRVFALKRLGDDMGKKALLQLEESSEKIQDAYVEGLQGEK